MTGWTDDGAVARVPDAIEPIEDRLVVAIASSALFDLRESDKVSRELGMAAYHEYQQAHLNIPLAKGVASPSSDAFSLSTSVSR